MILGISERMEKNVSVNKYKTAKELKHDARVALNGKYSDIIKKENDNEIQTLLEHEVASLYIPAEKTAPAIIKIRHLGNKEISLSQKEASREFVLKVVEIICGGGLYHEESIKKTF